MRIHWKPTDIHGEADLQVHIRCRSGRLGCREDRPVIVLNAVLQCCGFVFPTHDVGTPFSIEGRFGKHAWRQISFAGGGSLVAWSQQIPPSTSQVRMELAGRC